MHMASKSEISVKLKVPQKAIPERNETGQISETELTTTRAKEKPKPSSQTTSKERGPKHPKPPKSTTWGSVQERQTSSKGRMYTSDASATSERTTLLRTSEPSSTSHKEDSSSTSALTESRASQPPESSAFYKKIYKSGRIRFMKDNNRLIPNQYAEFIKINADAGDTESILQQVAEGVVNKLWQIPHKNLLLSVTAGADEMDEEGRKAFKEGINKMLPGTCMVTGGTNDGVTRLVGDAASVFNKQKLGDVDYCPTIGIVCVDHIQNKDNKDTLKPWELTRGAFGIDSDGQLFTVDKNDERWTLNPSSLTEVKVQSDGITTANALTDDDHGTSCSPRFAVGDLVQIGIDLESVKSAMGKLWHDCKEGTLGKLGIIVEVDEKDNYLNIKVNKKSWLYSPKAVTLLTGERFIGPLKTHFETYEPSDKDDKLVKAVMQDSVENVYAIIRRAYQDFHELTSASFGVDDSYSFFVVDANGDRRTFNPDDLTKDSITNAIESNANHIPRDFAEGDLVVILESRIFDETVGNVGTIVRLSKDELFVRVCGDDHYYSQTDVALMNRGRYDLLKEHFKTHKSAYEKDELQQAVSEDNFEKVTGIIRKAYKDVECRCEYELPTAIADLQDNKTNKERYLNPHHDLFVLVEKSTFSKFGGEIEFRANLEKRISSEMIRSRRQEATNQDRSDKQAPIVNIVLNGDENTLESVLHAINTDIPSVVVKGSKGLADVIANNFELLTEPDTYKRQDYAIADSDNKILASMIHFNRQRFYRIDFVREYQKHLLAVINLCDVSKMLGEMTLDICWKAGGDGTCLAKQALFEYDKADVLRRLVCRHSRQMASNDIACIMHYFFMRNDVEVVQALVLQNCCMNSAWIEALEYRELCNQVDTDGLLKSLLPKLEVSSSNKDLATIHNVIQAMTARPVRGSRDDKAVNVFWRPHPDVSSKPTPKNRSLCFGEKKEKKGGLGSVESIESQNRFLPYWNYLFLWACMRRKHELAEILLRKVENPIAMVLLTYNLFKAVERQTNDKVLKTEMQKYMKKLSTWATGTLNECAQRDDTKTNQILTLVIPVWKKTCIELAIESKHMEFLDQQAVRSLLATVWNGNLEDTTTLRFFSCIMCPALSPKLLNYKTDKRTTQYNSDTRTAQEKISSNFGKIKVFLLAPKTKFAYNLISYLMFLSLFAFVLLFDLASTISNIEYVLMTWVLAILVEEIRQMATSDEKKEYFSDGWNIIDICSIVMFFIGFGLRFKHFQDEFDWPRVVLAVDFVAFCFRLIHIFSVQNILGPKLIMIQRMFQDLVYFLVILVVFLLSYAIASHSILFPDSPVTWETFRQIIRKPYWHLYGELFLEDTEDFADCTTDVSLWTNATYPRCPSKTGQIVVPIMMGMYMLFTNILLLNLLIAMFSHTFTVIHKQSESLWCYQRYFILKEYGMRPAICPPLNICWHIYDLVQRVCCQHATVEDPFRFYNDKKRSNSASTDEGKSTIQKINNPYTLYLYIPPLQNRVRTLVGKVYGDMDTIVEKTNSNMEDCFRRIKQMANTLQSLWKVVFRFDDTCTCFRLKGKLNPDKNDYEFPILYDCENTMNTIQQQICDLETNVEVLLKIYNLPLHVLQRNSFEKYIESENKTQSERTDTMIKTINDRLNHLTEHEEEFRNTISTQLNNMQEKKDLVESKTKEEETFRSTISTQLNNMQEKIDLVESKTKEEETFRSTILNRTNQAFKEEEEFRYEMRTKNKDADKKEDQFRLILDEFKKVQANFDALNEKVHALEIKVEGQSQVGERTHL